jgi:outer membrane protein OmpA-like peptidoglycan-associated protein
MAVKRQAEEALSSERKDAKDQILSANSKATNAIAGRSKAEDAQAKAELAKGQSDTERTAALALATSAAASSTVSQADATEARTAANDSKMQMDAANSRAKMSDDRAQLADDRATAAEGDKVALRAQLLAQLNAVLQTQDTARGLIVNMSNALFQTGSSVLQPMVREKLAKIAGIVSAYPGLKLDVEGYTDNVGGDEYNQQLSEKRAQSAQNYLVSQGVPADSIVSQGFGKTNPIDSNETVQGRQNNRRSEIVVSGAPIGLSAKAE